MDTTITVAADEIEPVALSVGDSAQLLRWKGRLLRGVPAADADAFNRLFECGLVAALIERGVLVRSWVAPIRVAGYALVIEHDLLDAPTYPKEWSFSMLKDAALLILEINEIASRYGYQTKDCHGYNILFHRSRPVFVDLGSFILAAAGNPVLLAYQEFLRSYDYPLRIWRTGGAALGQRAVPRVGSLLPAQAYFKYRVPIARLVSDATLARWIQRIQSVRTLSHRSVEDLAARFQGWRARAAQWLRSSRLARAPATFASLRQRISHLQPPRGDTLWSDYQAGMDSSGAHALDARFTHVATRLASLGARSVLEIAGNQGVLARALAASNTMRVICTDADLAAVDRGYCAARKSNALIDWAVFNPFCQETSPQELPPSERFRVDAVVALALTHHLLLTQRLGIARVLSVLGSFADRFVFIEFMPLGLWDGTSAPPIPEWYTEAWFREEFERQFELVERTQLEPNRVLFVGRMRKDHS